MAYSQGTTLPGSMQPLPPLYCARARANLALYGILTRSLKPYPHHQGIIDAVAPPAWNKGCCVVCPPGSGKSTWISEIAIPWYIANHPDHFVLHIHANDDKADSYNKTIQQTFEANVRHGEIFPDVAPDFDRGWSGRGLYFKWRDRTGQWPIVDAQGWAHMPAKDPQYMAIGFNGGTIGRRADLIVLDDPYDPQEIDSPTFRQKFERRFKMVVKTRLRPGGRIVMVCNRWHYDDIVPKMEDMGYPVYTFPAIKEHADGSKESYWPELWSLDYLEDTRNELGAVDFNCLYQGDPSGTTGLMIKREWFKYFRYDPQSGLITLQESNEQFNVRALRLFQAVDPAASVKDWADFFVIATMGADDKGRLFLLDIVRKRLEGPDQVPEIRAAYDRWHPYAIGVEKAAYQLTLVQYAQRAGLPIIELERYGDKTSRHLTLGARYQAGAIYHRVNVPWLADYEQEITRLPKGAHDDMADAAADCAQGLASRGAVVDHRLMTRLNQSKGRVLTGLFAAGGSW